ncbi:MAG TPA: bacterioferritin [Bacteroidia bacterium]|nr:bacterioferritin [Bacteroidia bacterium]
MKGNKKIISRLNELLADELTAIGQYVVHAEICENLGYTKLHDVIKRRAIDEMGHAEKLIARILFLEGMPEIHGMKKISIGNDVAKQFKSDRDAELEAVKMYNESIGLVSEQDDNGTRDLLVSILKDEERHLDWLETQNSLVENLGLQNYLLSQAG